MAVILSDSLVWLWLCLCAFFHSGTEALEACESLHVPMNGALMCFRNYCLLACDARFAPEKTPSGLYQCQSGPKGDQWYPSSKVYDCADLRMNSTSSDTQPPWAVVSESLCEEFRNISDVEVNIAEWTMYYKNNCSTMTTREGIEAGKQCIDEVAKALLQNWNINLLNVTCGVTANVGCHSIQQEKLPEHLTATPDSNCRKTTCPCGSQTTFSCAEGYSLIGSQSASCNCDKGQVGEWSEGIPRCMGCEAHLESSNVDEMGIKYLWSRTNCSSSHCMCDTRVELSCSSAFLTGDPFMTCVCSDTSASSWVQENPSSCLGCEVPAEPDKMDATALRYIWSVTNCSSSHCMCDTKVDLFCKSAILTGDSFMTCVCNETSAAWMQENPATCEETTADKVKDKNRTRKITWGVIGSIIVILAAFILICVIKRRRMPKEQPPMDVDEYDGLYQTIDELPPLPLRPAHLASKDYLIGNNRPPLDLPNTKDQRHTYISDPYELNDDENKQIEISENLQDADRPQASRESDNVYDKCQGSDEHAYDVLKEKNDYDVCDQVEPPQYACLETDRNVDNTVEDDVRDSTEPRPNSYINVPEDNS